MVPRILYKIKRFYNQEIHFLQLHYFYILALILITTGCFYLQPNTNWSYIDALFMATTAATNTGLNTINMSTLTGLQLAVMFLCSFLGSHIMISIIIVYVRRHYFSKRFEDVLLFNKAQRIKEENKRKFEKHLSELENHSSLKRRLSFLSVRSTPNNTNILPTFFNLPRPLSSISFSQSYFDLKKKPDTFSLNETEGLAVVHPREAHLKPDTTEDPTIPTENCNISTPGIAFADNVEKQREMARKRLEQERKFEDILQKIKDKPNNTSNDSSSIELEEDKEEMSRIMREPIHKSELTKQQRYRIGGAEYRAIDLLTRLVPAYYLFFIFGFGFFIRIYIALSSYAQQVLKTANSNGPMNPWTFSFFTSISSFNNLGLSPIDPGMVPFQSAPAMLILNMILILAGNTAYAIFLRLIIWILYKITPKSYYMKREALGYLLDNPRRCYTTLFPATQTRWLLIVLVAITCTEWIAFLALNYWLPVLDGIDWGSRILDGLFQSVATRNAGYGIVDIMKLNPGTQIVFIVAMYISVYPVAISMRNSNVYQERALGIYRDDEDYDVPQKYEQDTNYIHRLKRNSTITSIMTTSKKILRKPDFFVMEQIQRQLTSDIGWVICGIFAICVIEAEAIMSPSPITVSTVMYECVSAFGTAGASTGYPDSFASQAQQYHTISKLVLIILMYKGRHRGLPAAIDRAVLLPSEQLEQKEQEDNLLRKRNPSISTEGNHIVFYNRSLTL